MIFGKRTIKNVFLRYLMDFLIVFAGVYVAFLLGNYQQNNFNRKERKKILVALKGELDQFRIFTPGYADFQQEKIEEWKKSYNEGNYTGWNGYRYLEPQYNYRIIEYAMNREGTEIIDFELFQELQFVYDMIRKLEHAERLMTEFGNKRDMNPAEEAGKNQNRFYFNKFIGYAGDRMGIQKRLAEQSKQVLQLINDRLTPETKKETEQEFVCKVLQFGNSEDIVELLREGFPGYSEEEWQEMLDYCSDQLQLPDPEKEPESEEGD